MNQRRIGISGFMGAGKTTCCGLLSAALREAGATVRIIDADAEAKRILRDDGTIRDKLAATFGEAVLSAGGIDSAALGSLAFGSPSSLRLLNGIVHPVLLEKLRGLIFCGDTGSVICDAALIPLWHIEDWFDALLWVNAPFEERFRRLRNKLPLSEGQLTDRMTLQERLMPEPHRAPWNSIDNHGSVGELRRSVYSLIKEQFT
jgi:dephospho-CoA kinase